MYKLCKPNRNRKPKVREFDVVHTGHFRTKKGPRAKQPRSQGPLSFFLEKVARKEEKRTLGTRLRAKRRHAKKTPKNQS